MEHGASGETHVLGEWDVVEKGVRRIHRGEFHAAVHLLLRWALGDPALSWCVGSACNEHKSSGQFEVGSCMSASWTTNDGICVSRFHVSEEGAVVKTMVANDHCEKLHAEVQQDQGRDRMRLFLFPLGLGVVACNIKKTLSWAN